MSMTVYESYDGSRVHCLMFTFLSNFFPLRATAADAWLGRWKNTGYEDTESARSRKRMREIEDFLDRKSTS